MSEEKESARRKGKGREQGKGGREEEGDPVAEQQSDCEEERRKDSYLYPGILNNVISYHIRQTGTRVPGYR